LELVSWDLEFYFKSPHILHNFSIIRVYYGIIKGKIRRIEMKNFTKRFLISTAVAGIMVLGIGGVVFAANPNAGNTACPNYPAHLNQGLGLGSSQGGNCLEVVSDLTGLTIDQIRDTKQDGKTLAEIAAEKGITEEKLVAAIVAECTEQIQAKVTAGTLTQAQADAMLAQVGERVQTNVDKVCSGAGNAAGQAQGAGRGNGGAGKGACGMTGRTAN
jgi:hypothetical protein